MKMTLVNNFYSWVKTVLLSNENVHLLYTQKANSYDTRNRLVYVMGDLKTINGTLLERIVIFNYSYYSNMQITGLGYFNNNSHNTAIGSTDLGATYFKVGQGTTAVTLDDYALEQPIEENVVIELSGMHTKKEAYFNLTVVNSNTEQEVSISEIGLFKTLATQYNIAAVEVLLGRIVLNSPILLPPQESRTIQISIEI